MSTFANLMALSASQTRQQESAVEATLRERQRKEAERRKQQEEREAKEKEREKQRLLKLMEDRKREEERRKQQAEAKAAKERALQKREEEQRDKLLYGPKKPAKHPSSASAGPSRSGGGSRSGGRRLSDESDDDSGGPVPLTREEKRERKLQNELKRLDSATKRASAVTGFGGYRKSGSRLPGGAVNITVTSTNGSPAGSEYKSVKDRLAAMPNGLVKLNTKKRDTRTIDEIVRDRARAKEGKVLEGDQALVFDDWFGTKKKEDKKVAPVQSRPSSVPPTSGTNTPLSSQQSSAVAAQKRAAPVVKPAPVSRPPVASGSRFSTTPVPSSRPSISSRPTTSDRAADKAKSTHPSKPNKSTNHDPYASTSSKYSSSAAHKKRARSTSYSESPPPPKRRHRSPVDSDDLDEDYSSAIWKLFGRDRNKYVNQDVFSDDEDMEADARALEREEKFSARLAAQEDQRALEEERRHEEEKRRRRKERERFGA